MKSHFILNTSICLILISLLFSCKDKNEDSLSPDGRNTNWKANWTNTNENTSTNGWIYDEMNYNYYWNTTIPEADKISYYNDSPDKFFYKILYKYKTQGGDRFSYLEHDGVPQFSGEVASGEKPSYGDIGFEFIAYREDESLISPVHIFVAYIKAGSRAAQQGELKRGDWIVAIDNTPLTRQNFSNLIYSGKPTINLTLQTGRTIALQTTNVFYENPIHLSKIFNIGGKKIGYIVYNFFADGTDSDQFKYAIEINNILSSFKQQNIDELILDLRYNGGGYVSSGTYIASAIVPNRETNTIYTRRKYNDILEKEYKNHKNNPFKNAINGQLIPQLALNRLFVITSDNTASASEQIINGLRVYMTVETIGLKTVGKNMESFQIEDKNSTWILHPLTSVSYNAKDDIDKNDYSTGFPPTIGGYNREVDSFTHQVYELGDQREKLLALALNYIAPGATRSDKIAISTKSEIEPIGSSLSRKGQRMIIEQIKK